MWKTKKWLASKIKMLKIFIELRDLLQILLIILSQSKQINQLLFPLKLSENYRLSDDFRGNRC